MSHDLSTTLTADELEARAQAEGGTLFVPLTRSLPRRAASGDRFTLATCDGYIFIGTLDDFDEDRPASLREPLVTLS